MISRNLTNIIGGIVGTVAAFIAGSVFYDYAMPVVGAAESIVTPVVRPGEYLVITHSGVTPRQCPASNIKLTIIDASGVEYNISSLKITVAPLSATEIMLSVIVPKQAALGTAMFNMSYDKVCPVLVFFRSTHVVRRPELIFTIG